MASRDMRSAGRGAVVENWLVARIADMQRIEPEQVDVDESFIANGLSSSSSVALIGELAKFLGVALPETLTWEYPTIAALAEYVAGLAASRHDGGQHDGRRHDGRQHEGRRHDGFPQEDCRQED